MESPSVHLDDASSVVAAVEGHEPYLRNALAAPPDEGWLASAALIEQPALLRGSIASTQAGRGAPDLQVAASLWFQAYAFRAAVPVVAPFALGLPGFSADPQATSIRLARSRPAAVAVTDPAVRDRSAEAAAQELLAGHRLEVAEAVAASHTVGHRLLWGNAAASVAAVLRAVEGAPGADRAVVRARAGELVDAAQPWIAGLGSFELGEQGWRWGRTNCCLYDRCDGASRCEDCSLQAVAS